MRKKRKNNHHLNTAIGRPALFVAVVVIFAGAALGIYRYYQAGLDNISTKEATKPKATLSQTKTDGNKKEAVLAPSKDLSVPYAAQAPFGNWSVHEESCEEAAILMYHEYFSKTPYPSNRIPDGTADPIYRSMKLWQTNNYGKEPDLDMGALGRFAKEYYGYSYNTKEATEKTIKEAISNGYPVVVPVMTHSLENKMYGPYSVYHVLLIKGYDATGVITNDAGVGNGPGHHYDWNILWQAIDAQTSKMGQGRVMLTLSD